jgi:hypothetical protein
VGSERAICTRVHKLTHGLDRGSTISEPLARPIATNVAMDRTSSCVHEHDRYEFLRTSMLLATMIANEHRVHDESRERASSDATRVAMNYRMFDCDKDRDEQVNLRTRERTKSNARRLAWTDRIDLDGCSRERTNPWQ